MKVLIVEPLKDPYVKDIDSSLVSMQSVVGGLIQAIYPFDHPVALICNEEGKLIGLPPNRRMGRDIICGTFYFLGQDPDEGELTSLPEHLIEYLSKQYAVPDVIDPEEVEKTIMTEFYVI